MKISMIGINHYYTTPLEKLWWMIPLSVLVFVGFYTMFTGIVRKYAERIHSLPGPKEPVYKTFSLKGSLSNTYLAFQNHSLPGSIWDWG